MARALLELQLRLLPFCLSHRGTGCWLLFLSPVASLVLPVQDQRSHGCGEEKPSGFSFHPLHAPQVLLGREEGLAAAQPASLPCPGSSPDARESPSCWLSLSEILERELMGY
uniref:Uncharacterized protein n=1 Tax=Sphaerodactylus townsendi TaxID=933632 RepID=A0ACB8FHX9_9SAUR